MNSNRMNVDQALTHLQGVIWTFRNALWEVSSMMEARGEDELATVFKGIGNLLEDLDRGAMPAQTESTARLIDDVIRKALDK